MNDILAPETVSRIDEFYDTTLKPKLDAIDHQRRQVRWLIIKSLLVVLPPIGILIGGDLLDGIPPFISSGARIATTLLHRMRDQGAKYGLATMCVGQGQGVATLFEACEN